MRICTWIFERLFCDPRVIRLSQLGRKSFDVKVQELIVPGLMRSKRLHEHASVNCCLLHALHRQQTRSAFERVKFVHQAIALPRPCRRLIPAPRRAECRQGH
jgi:hypothetical protein